MSLTRLCRLTHLMVVMTNVMQMLFMIGFLVLLLLQLDGELSASWFVIFLPLWASDAITLGTGVHEMRRLSRTTGSPGAPRRNAIINQLNRFKGCACVVAFKCLLALRLNGVLPDMEIRVVASPYYVAAVLRFVLHFCKTPVVPPVSAGTQRPSRPGTPVNPVQRSSSNRPPARP